MAVLGLGGIGKTALATHTARELAPHFEGLCWRSLRNAPPPEEWLAAAIAALAPTPARRCRPACRRGWGCCWRCCGSGAACWCWTTWRPCWSRGRPRGATGRGTRATGRCCGRWRRASTRACLLLTGREAPPELALLAGAAPVRALRLGGLDLAACRALLQDKGLVGDEAAWQALVARYGGNPLALNLVGQTIVELFGGEIDALLA